MMTAIKVGMAIARLLLLLGASATVRYASAGSNHPCTSHAHCTPAAYSDVCLQGGFCYCMMGQCLGTTIDYSCTNSAQCAYDALGVVCIGQGASADGSPLNGYCYCKNSVCTYSRSSAAPISTPTTTPTTRIPTTTPTTTPTTDIPTATPTTTPTTGMPTATPTVTKLSAVQTAMPTTALPTTAPSTGRPTTESPTTDNTYQCTNKVIDPILGYHDCGWGIWNDGICECVCDNGFCLSNNQKCYDGCTTHLDFNPYGGCVAGSKGTDGCPWFRSKTGGTHCESSADFAGIHALRETAELCCKQHFSYLNAATCVAASEAAVEAAKAKVEQDLARQKFYWPDMHGRKNCVFDSGYDDYMAGAGHSDFYLFDEGEECCGMWYPAREDCPDESAVTPNKPNGTAGVFYPHLVDSNCRFGRNYPMWMNLSPEHYIYTTAEECCHTWYPSNENCPLLDDDGEQDGFFWIVDGAFFPNWKGNWCAQGNDYPEWMSDPTQRETHLFKTAKACCDLWFPHESLKCQANISTSNKVLAPTLGMWYPMLSKHECVFGDPEEWMKQPGYGAYYIFDSHAECCKAHYCNGPVM